MKMATFQMLPTPNGQNVITVGGKLEEATVLQKCTLWTVNSNLTLAYGKNIDNYKRVTVVAIT